MMGLKYLVAILATGLAFSSLLAGQQPPHCAQILFCLVNQEATATDPAGIHKYSEGLIEAIVPPGAGKEGFEPLANRLAQAEQKARAGQGKLVPETNVVRAFNELMTRIGAPASLKTDVASIHRFREHAATIKAFPALFSADRNGTNCNPGEAVFLLSLLISEDGVLHEKNLDTSQALSQPYNKQSRGGFGVFGIEIAPDSQRLLSSYISGHKRNETIALFNNLAGTLSF
jgi:hypothetical protein